MTKCIACFFLAVSVFAQCPSGPSTSCVAFTLSPLRYHILSPLENCRASSCLATVNVPFDSQGTACPAGTWGICDSRTVPIQFEAVPQGYAVEIEELYGDVIAWVHGMVPSGMHSGVLWGLTNSAEGLSPNVQYGAQGCLIYLQGAVGQGDLTRPFDQIILAGGLLPADNILTSQEAVFLNDTGASVHMEATFAIAYRFIRL
jgi:hypothetical protein